MSDQTRPLRSDQTSSERPDLSLREATFWDRQEERIDELYQRPHDWRFVPSLADRIVAPRLAFIRRALSRYRHEIRSVLDIGCGSGWFSHACAALGLNAIGVDLSSKKIESASRLAEEKGVASRCRFVAGDVMSISLDQPVDLLAACGSLHHLPGLSELFPRLVRRHLRENGLMIFSEPHHEGMPPLLHRWIVKVATSRRFRSWFDWELFEQAAADGIRGESPAGLEHPGGHVQMATVLRESGHRMLGERYFDLLTGHLANTFSVFMKRRVVRGLFRAAVPALVGLDGLLCRVPRLARYASEGVWVLRRQA